jgi:hypothetical protein
MYRVRALYQLRALALLTVVAPGLGGCTALALANRGAPPEQMKTFDVELAPVNLDAFTAHPGGHDHGAMIAHDHNAPDHDIDEHIAFLEQQMAQEGEPSMPPAHHGVLLPAHSTVFPESGWLHGFDFELVDSRGESLPADVLHHLQVLVPNRRELFSPMMLRVAGAGGETRAPGLPAEVGYRVAAGDSVIFTAMLHNPTSGPLGDVKLRIRLRYSPEGGSWQPPADVVPFFTHVTPPLEETVYDLPAGRSEHAIEVRPAVSGTVLAMGGHLHRYGVGLRVEDVETNEVLWESDARRLGDGTVIEIPNDILVWGGSFDLVAGHPYRVVAVYDNPTGQMIPDGAMGTVGGVMRPRGDWPSVERSDVTYRWDWERMLGSGSGESHYGTH